MEDYSFHGRKHIKRDYYNKTYSNPYFKARGKFGRQFNTKLYIEVLTAVFLIYIIIYSALFKVKTVEVQGTDMINPEEISALVNNNINRWKLFIFPGKNLLFINTGKIKNEIASKYSLNKLEISKSWQKLAVVLEEKAAYLIANNNKTYYFIDGSGTVTKELTANDLNKYGSKFPQLSLVRDLKINEQPVSGRYVNYILELDSALKAANIKIKGYDSGGVDQVTVLTEPGWKAHFSINNPVSRSMENLLLVLNKKLAGKKFEYIDLRFGDRVYFPE
jgi:cell division septal protein FtsQ